MFHKINLPNICLSNSWMLGAEVFILLIILNNLASTFWFTQKGKMSQH